MKNPKCWANHLNNCVAVMSGEHRISKNVFGDAKKIDIKGYDWCLRETITVGINSLVANILCKSHNERLSILDDEMKRLGDSLNERDRLQAERDRLNLKRPGVVSYQINGPLLERWFMKTVINEAFEGPHPIGGMEAPPGWPTPALVEQVYGLRRLNHTGLFTGGALFDETAPPGEIPVSVAMIVNKPPGLIAGAYVTLRGYRFMIWLLDGRPPPPNLGRRFAGWGDPIMIRHLSKFRFTMAGRKTLSQQVTFRWYLIVAPPVNVRAPGYCPRVPREVRRWRTGGDRRW